MVYSDESSWVGGTFKGSRPDMTDRKAQLRAIIWSTPINPTPEEKAKEDSARLEYEMIEAKEQGRQEAESEKITSRIKKARKRGKNAEYACAKATKGVVVGRSKAVKVGDKWVQVNCQKPPDVLSPPFFSWECKNTKFPKSVAKAVSQAIANAPHGFDPWVWWYDAESDATYIITIKPVFLELHI